VVERQRVGVPASATLVASWEAATMMNRLSRPEEMAAAAVFLEGEEASYVTGSALMVEGGGAAR
jgi:NAD(P)-dependent dehydrogenase (short-subunit alcohol dehydrogenase family)